jgi:UDP:flavonoid glycosyltransferase YjiC (YdhE family)
MDVDAVATIGSHMDPSILGEVPRNVRVERFVPQRFVLERAAAVLSHAGAGSVLGAARRGIPQVLNPLAADQWENADAANDAGLAITCELDQRSDVDIATALSSILNDPQYRDAAAKVSDEIEAMPAPADHVATIEALVA